MSTTIESLELELKSNSQSAVSGIEALATSLEKLRTATKGGLGLSSIAKNLGAINSASGKINGTTVNNIKGLTTAIQGMSNLGNIKISSTISKQIAAIGGAVGGLNINDITSKIQGLTTALQPLRELGKSNLSSYLTPLRKLPETLQAMNTVDMRAFYSKIQEITRIIRPFADEMQKVANGFAAFPARIQSLIASSNKLSATNGTLGKSYINLYAKLKMAWTGLKSVGRIIASMISKMNDYIENINLFNVAMGEYAGEAGKYAETVGEIMGIDPGDWMRNQGVFMTLATGFGVVGDRAAKMSQQLTQLGYDISSFFNIGVEDAMQKLQSGISGELEPLRRLGYDLSQAKLEATALSLGIDKSVSSMTQAEKAQLRYYAIMTQVTTAQGDMARTLTAPANQLRIFKSQVTQAARAIGSIFIPLLNAVLPYLIAVAKVVRLVASAIANLFGFELPEVDYSGIQTAAGGAEDLSDALGSAGDAAKKLKNYTMGFDELNVIDPNSGSSGGSDGGAGIGGDLGFELPEYDFLQGLQDSKVAQIVNDMKEWLGLTQEINSWSEFFDTNLGQILITVGLIGLGLGAWKITKSVINGVAALKELSKLGLDKPLTITAGVTLALTGLTLETKAIVDAIRNGLDGLNFGEIIAGGSAITAGGALIGKVLGSTLLGGAIGGIVAGVPAFVTGVFDALKNGLNWLNALLIPAGASAGGAGIGAIIGMLGGPIGAGVGALIGLVVGLVTDGIIWLCQNWGTVVDFFKGVWESIAGFFSNLWADIVGIWSTVATWFDTNVIQPVVGFFSALWTSVSGFFSNLWADIVGIWNAVATWFNDTVITPVRNFFSGMWEGIKTAAGNAWTSIKEFFQPALEWFSELFGSIQQTINDIFYNIGVIVEGCWEVIKRCWEVVSTWFNDNVIIPVTNFFKGLWESITGFFTNLWADIVGIWNSVSNWFDVNVVQPVVGFFRGAWGSISGFFSNLWTDIKGIWNGVANWFSTSVVEPIKGFFSELWDGIKRTASDAWDGIKNVFSTVGTFFKDTFTKAWQGIVNVFSVAGDIFNDIKNGVVNAFKTIVNALIKGINKVVSIPFNAINAALRFIRSIKILDIQPFSGLREINVPQIPLLAEGGFVDTGQMFIAREAGAELVGTIGRRTAVANNEQIVEGIASGVAEANGEQNALLREQNALLRALLEKDSGVYLDGRSLTKSVEKYQRERGRVVITGGVV